MDRFVHTERDKLAYDLAIPFLMASLVLLALATGVIYGVQQCHSPLLPPD